MGIKIIDINDGEIINDNDVKYNMIISDGKKFYRVIRKGSGYVARYADLKFKDVKRYYIKDERFSEIKDILNEVFKYKDDVEIGKEYNINNLKFKFIQKDNEIDLEIISISKSNESKNDIEYNMNKNKKIIKKYTVKIK